MKLKFNMKTPSYREVLQCELDQARLSLLESETELDWAQAKCDYNYSRIERLEKRLSEAPFELGS